ncbi:helix-turn-helix transcriptional regulator [Gordonibacter faecis]|uniref:Helix-turn-helix transcriptional regulator n=2 Tax=Gordonibacter TaxID=644652 RepID=A0ABT7DJJ5_9ACTN|nr:helix-turn-helix transcriptional regulator [Gordonibacter sp. KGMB12511]MDJ1649427.1 helix-turn-helix transcriptional regulator [Gordonibacter sp. KGMB12511]HIW75109.1 helix-turn-helix transcriptional regulator [Candidatus Gordonibacter avicola]
MGQGAKTMRHKVRASLRPVVGFACNQGFVFSLFYLGTNRALAFGPHAFERADLFGTLAFMVVAFVLLRAASERARAALLSRPLLWCYAALLVVGSALPTLAADVSAAGLLVECVLVGMPAGFMLAAWGRALGARPFAQATFEVFAGSALGATVCLALSLVPVAGVLLALKLLPVGSVLALRGLAPFDAPRAKEARADAGESEGEGSSLSFGDLFATSAQRAETARLSKKIVAGTVLFGLAAGFMETYGSEPGMASTPTFSATLLLFVLFCIAALQFIATPAEDAAAPVKEARRREVRGAPLPTPTEAEGPLDSVYRLAILVMMAGFLFVPVLSDFGVPGEAIVLAGYLGLTYVLVSLFLVMARLTGQDAALSFARGFTALFAGEMAGIGLGNVLDVAVPTGQTPYVVVACAGLAALFAYLFLFTERDFRALSVIARDADRFDDACAYIVQTCSLSKREAEILPLALRGRTGERIAAEFFISKSTVDTHLRRIYTKCGVHNRQELIDLGERTARAEFPDLAAQDAAPAFRTKR